jgi:CheY-like chemotaxis protein
VVEAADRAGHLTKQLLAFSRKQVMQTTVLDAGEVVKGLAPMVQRLIGEHITLRLALSDDLGRVLADRGQLEQVIMNLCINARDAMPHGGVLTVSTSNGAEARAGDAALPTDGRVLVTVSDTGTGIPEQIRERIFEPFFTTKEVGKGTGLGLSTVYGIVKQSGGTIHVESKVGVGTTFIISLPAVSDRTDGATAGSALELPRGKETVLLVEDDSAVRSYTRRTLEQLGYTVLAAGDPLEALALAGTARIDLVLSDIVMPRMSGPQMVQRFLVEHPAPVVVFMTGYADQTLLVEGRELGGGAEVLRKPFTALTLARTLRDALDASRRAGAAGIL